MKYDLSLTLDLPYEKAVTEVRAALKEQGFGVLTEIDVQATMRDKLDADMEPYVILGACNPSLAHRALEADRMIGLLLPCNVVVRADGEERSLVQALDPRVMIEVPEREELRPVAEEAGKRIRAALDALSALAR
ncbi:ABC transporter ATP-binding protein [Streptomyces sp. WAC 05977]|nr:ABC transporter ATP-binding protein [Streptomyces sp. WAC 05977]